MPELSNQFFAVHIYLHTSKKKKKDRESARKREISIKQTQRNRRWHKAAMAVLAMSWIPPKSFLARIWLPPRWRQLSPALTCALIHDYTTAHVWVPFCICEIVALALTHLLISSAYWGILSNLSPFSFATYRSRRSDGLPEPTSTPDAGARPGAAVRQRERNADPRDALAAAVPATASWPGTPPSSAIRK